MTKKKCADCSMPGDDISLKPAFLRPGKWTCRDRGACETRITNAIKIRIKKNEN